MEWDISSTMHVKKAIESFTRQKVLRSQDFVAKDAECVRVHQERRLRETVYKDEDMVKEHGR